MEQAERLRRHVTRIDYDGTNRQVAITLRSNPPMQEETGRRGRTACLEAIGDRSTSTPSLPVPRIARLLALAWHVEGLVRAGTVSSYAAAARLGHVSRARLSQILSLLNLAPDLQEQLLFHQRPARGRQALALRHVLTVAAVLD